MTDDLRALNARFIHNFITNDVPSHDAILHPDFICITPIGARVSRADYLKAWATGFDAARIPYFDYRDEKIDVFGTTALLRSHLHHADRCPRQPGRLPESLGDRLRRRAHPLLRLPRREDRRVRHDRPAPISSASRR